MQCFRPSSIVNDSLLRNPKDTPSSIQRNTILGAIRARSSWSKIDAEIKKVSCKKSISNEKVKQLKEMNLHGVDYAAVKELKSYLDVKDPFLIYEIDENEQYVFKTSKEKLLLAAEIQKEDGFVYFDGKEKRTKNFTTLTASVYNPFLQQQIPLASMDCKSEDKVNVARFWRVFNRAFKEATSSYEIFRPFGWVTDMAMSNLNGLALVYGEEAVLSKAKGCEFHFKRSVNRRKGIFKEDLEDVFVSLTNQLLCASTEKAYVEKHLELKNFLMSNGGEELIDWLSWWNARRRVMFRAFTGHNKPRSNLAEVVHASWVNRGQVIIYLLYLTYIVSISNKV